MAPIGIKSKTYFDAPHKVTLHHETNHKGFIYYYVYALIRESVRRTSSQMSLHKAHAELHKYLYCKGRKIKETVAGDRWQNPQLSRDYLNKNTKIYDSDKTVYRFSLTEAVKNFVSC